jgi:alcohol dehydrogenase class IV
MGARIVKPKKELYKMKGLFKVCKKLPPLFVIPTTAGTGSETTVTSVITDSKTHHKYLINDFSLIPHYAVLDYSVTLGLPPHITSTTGMDALTHAIEAFIGNTRTPETKKMSLEATRLIVKSLKTCYHDPKNAEARKDMLYASHYAGISFTKAYVGYVHAIAHTLGGKYGVPHGLANAVILPIMLEEYGAKAYKKLAVLARYSEVASNEDDDEIAAKKLIFWIKEANKEMNIPSTIDAIKEEDIQDLAKTALKEGNPLYPVPVLMDSERFKDIYLKIKNG